MAHDPCHAMTATWPRACRAPSYCNTLLHRRPSSILHRACSSASFLAVRLIHLFAYITNVALPYGPRPVRESTPSASLSRVTAGLSPVGVASCTATDAPRDAHVTSPRMRHSHSSHLSSHAVRQTRDSPSQTVTVARHASESADTPHAADRRSAQSPAPESETVRWMLDRHVRWRGDAV
jgi:hypothetical protein